MRSAPAPDLLPIPGMNQGTAVAAGSGGSGDGDGNAGDGGDGEGAGGGGGGKDADGDNRSSPDCGAGSAAGHCPTHSAQAGAGHPVDPVSGAVYTQPETDVYLPGLLPLQIVRYYRSTAIQRNVGLGFGWTHSLAWSIEVRRGAIVVHTEDGRSVEFAKPRDESPVEGPEGWTVQAIGEEVQLRAKDGLRRVFAPLTPDRALGVLSLVAVVDRRGHRISLDYQNELLIGIRDSVGRVVRLRRTPRGEIAAFEVRNAPAQGQWVPFSSYTYDEAGDLISAADADGVTTRFGYAAHRLVSERQPSGLTFRFVYDPRWRCIETWGEHDHAEDAALDPEVPKVLADRATRAKGIFHVRLNYGKDRYTEVVDSRRVRRVFGNHRGKVDKQVDGGRVTTWQFDSRGNPVAREDSAGGVTRWEYDESGRLSAYIDENGGKQTLVRDTRGEIEQVIDANGGCTKYVLDDQGNVEAVRDPLDRVRSYRRDDRGLVIEQVEPNGGVYAFGYDREANLVEVRDPNGNLTSYTYDSFGHRTGYRNPGGGEWRFVFSAAGRVLAEYLPNGEAFRYSYDASGFLAAMATPDGRVARLVWGHFRKIAAVVQGDDRATRIFYDREGFVSLVRNPKGEDYRIERDIYGDPIVEQTFDGRINRYRRDVLGRVVEYETGAGDRMKIVRDALGQTIAREYSDDTKEEFEFDAMGRILAASNASSSIRIARNAAGEVVKEEVDSLGKTHFIERGYDPNGVLSHVGTSFGYKQDILRDPMGNRLRSVLDDTEVIQHEVDPLGHERVRRLSGGGRIERDFNDINRMTRYRVVSSVRSPPTMMEGEPDWLGARGTASAAASFEWSPMGLLRMAWHHTRGATHYDFDASARLVSALADDGQGEKFSYDAADNLFEMAGPAREYGKGGRLTRHGASELTWDDAGRLVEKRIATARGLDVWRFDWNAQSQLRSVTRPDQTLVEFDYDPFARRVRKRVSSGGGLLSVPDYEVRYIWDGEAIVREVKETVTGGPPIIEERTYAYGDEELVPLAQRSSGSAWSHYVIDARGAPAELVDGQGEVVWDRDLSVWGKTLREKTDVTTSVLGLPGQWEDAETGLSYNRNRYYDPDAGRYISADPIELTGGLNAYAYPTDPLDHPDLYGLDPHQASASIEKSPGGGSVPLGDFDSCQNGPAWNDLQNDPANRWQGKSQAYQGKKLSGLNSMMSHTEKKITTAARGAGFGPNDTLKITGTLPPCSTCKAFMKDLANANPGSKVEYHHDGADSPWKYP
jgi:RHS repeat-associated protein